MIMTAVLLLGLAPQASSSGVRCELRFNMSGWSAFYKRSSGTGTITCNNGQSLNVSIEARGGGLTVGRSTIENGVGEFSPVDDIRDLLGRYGSAEAHAGVGASAKGQVVTKGSVSLALSGTGRGVDLGVAFGSFVIRAR
ncbi:MAG TPA: hypothetical protein PKZ76_12605 [Xanthomonadaceae bacterium]|nr:hypothetical protein [Xanthomonadaceae bacterium]